MTAASMWSFISIYMILEEEGAVPRISCKVTGPSPERHANNNGVSLTLHDAGAEVTVADRLAATSGATIHMHAPTNRQHCDVTKHCNRNGNSKRMITAVLPKCCFVVAFALDLGKTC